MVAGCCAAPAFWAGRSDRCQEVLEDIRALWIAWGEPEVVTACASCTKMLKKVLPAEKVVSFYTRLAEKPPETAVHLTDGPVAMIDPCTARNDKNIQTAARQLITGTGLAVEELEASGKLTECCGFGGLTFNANPQMAGKIITARANQGRSGLYRLLRHVPGSPGPRRQTDLPSAGPVLARGNRRATGPGIFRPATEPGPVQGDGPDGMGVTPAHRSRGPS